MTHEIQTENFVANARLALDNVQLQSALAGAMEKIAVARGGAVAELGDDWPRLRDRAREIKEHVINHLDYYLREFADCVERQNGKVYWARDAHEANTYIANLAQRRGITRVVKSKSMISEEIALNDALAAAGIEAVETDLGEYIVQLAGERPSHINIPAVHKTRGDVAALLAEKLKVERPKEIGEMATLVRRTLRARFAEAEMGISGVNFAVAETGTIVLIENEGNIRFTTSMPRIHVAVMSIEKIVPRLEDLDVFLPLLTRSASGQKISSYVSFLTGVNHSPVEEGPEELHVVILDNGRTGMLADPHLRESLYCIRCGACLNSCPVYHKIGGHPYGWVYPGPIGAVLTPQLIGRERAADLPFASTLCGTCRDVCPLKINIPDMLLHLRYEIKEAVGTPTQHEVPLNRPLLASVRRRFAKWTERTLFNVWAATMKKATRYERVAGLARVAQRVYLSDSFINLRAALSVRLGSVYLPPRLARRSFRTQWAKPSPPVETHLNEPQTAVITKAGIKTELS
jgi:L-lactate dehydrogenase complex protein LldF